MLESSFKRNSNQKQSRESISETLQQDVENNIKALAETNRENAFEELYINFYGSIVAYCFVYVFNIDDARDITQEVFCKAYEQQNLFDKTFHIRGWIYTVARNQCIDFQGHKKHISYNLEQEIEDTNLSNPREKLSEKEDLLIIRDIISNIPERCREIVILKYFGDFSCSKIAKILGIKKGTVWSRLAYGRECLRKVLREIGYF